MASIPDIKLRRSEVEPVPGRPEHATRGEAPPAGSPAPTSLTPRRPPSRPSRPGRRLLFAGLAMILLGGVFLSYRYGVTHSMEIVTAASGPLELTLKGPGTFSALDSVNVSSRIQGLLVAVHVDRNDMVHKGELIADIASDDLESQLASAEASVDAARRAIEVSRSQLSQSETALQNARKSFDRQEALIRAGTTTQASYDGALATFRQAQADVTRANAVIAQAEADLRAAEANVRLNQAKLAETRIIAPFDGIVTVRQQNAGDMTTPGAPIVTLVDPGTIVVTARFDENAIQLVKPGQKARIGFSTGTEPALPATVYRLSREVDEETREFTVDIKPESLPDAWAIGRRGTAVVTTGVLSDVISLPLSAIVWDAGFPGVWHIESGRAKFARVTLGGASEDRIEILSGLAAGDEVISAPHGVYRGMRISPKGFS